MRATIRDVAREAGVSVSTVTYALKKGIATKASHKRVFEAARRLNYVPDATARSLVRGRTNSIGVIMPPVPTVDFTNPYFMQVLSALSSALVKREYWLSLYMPKVIEDAPMRRFLEDAKVDGLIWLVRGIPDGMANVLKSRGLPHVSVEYPGGCSHAGAAGAAVDTVLLDDHAGIASALDHVYGLGHRNVLFLGGYAPDDDGMGRTGACLARASELEGCVVRALNGGYSEKAAFKAVVTLVQDEGLPFSAVVTASDLMALGAMRALASLGISVPGDVSVIGFDDIPAAMESTPPLTTMTQRVEFAVDAACGHLFRCIDDPDSVRDEHPLRERVVPQLVVRESTGAVAR